MGRNNKWQKKEEKESLKLLREMAYESYIGFGSLIISINFVDIGDNDYLLSCLFMGKYVIDKYFPEMFPKDLWDDLPDPYDTPE
jgi:hypothetical protein